MIRIDADQQLTLGEQQRLLDVTTFNTWIEARRWSGVPWCVHRLETTSTSSPRRFQVGGWAGR
jgi:hypothetical protein